MKWMKNAFTLVNLRAAHAYFTTSKAFFLCVCVCACVHLLWVHLYGRSYTLIAPSFYFSLFFFLSLSLHTETVFVCIMDVWGSTCS